MKTSLVLLLLAGLTACALAQGTINFKNDSSNPVMMYAGWGADPPYIAVPKGAAYVQYFWAQSGTPYVPWQFQTMAYWQWQNPGWSFQPGRTGFNTPEAGVFAGGIWTLSPLLPPGSAVDMVVIGWTGNYTDMDAAMAGGGLVAVSAKFTTATGDPTATPAGVPGNISTVFPGLILAPIPEPGALALAGLGAAALLIFRRRF